MARALVFFVKVGIVVAVAVWLADRPGAVQIDWQGWRVETSVGVLGVATFAVIVLAAGGYRTWRSVVRAPRHFGQARRSRRRTAGYKALTQGMVAVAAGDPDEARRQAKKADELLNDPPLTMLLSAQAAQLGGDEAAAQRYFQAMLGSGETEFLGLRGLIVKALKDGDRAAALALARRAHTLRPQTPWVLDTLVDLQSRAGAWRSAQQALEEALRRKLVPPAPTKAKLAALLTERARDAEAADDNAAALEQLRRAHDLDPGLAPAMAHLARHLITGGQTRRARKLIEKTWPQAPHPALAAAYGEAAEATTALARFEAVKRLAALAPDHAESRLALAHAALEAKLWGEARKPLEALIEEAPSAQACRLMAALEDDEHDDAAAARHWLDQATGAEPDPAWVCGDCGAVADDWSAVCGQCDAFATLAWRVPPRVYRHTHQISGPAAPALEVTPEVPPPAIDEPPAPPDAPPDQAARPPDPPAQQAFVAPPPPDVPAPEDDDEPATGAKRPSFLRRNVAAL